MLWSVTRFNSDLNLEALYRKSVTIIYKAGWQIPAKTTGKSGKFFQKNTRFSGLFLAGPNFYPKIYKLNDFLYVNLQMILKPTNVKICKHSLFFNYLVKIGLMAQWKFGFYWYYLEMFKSLNCSGGFKIIFNRDFYLFLNYGTPSLT